MASLNIPAKANESAMITRPMAMVNHRFAPLIPHHPSRDRLLNHPSMGQSPSGRPHPEGWAELVEKALTTGSETPEENTT